ncbi:MAG: SpoIVB peptidase S55 domain-containing protein [Deltaproteobacteria bacterium]|nr:SpoIVB peptidase S55 domain-containing protein [Deltaproteobacteria bacterium]
MAIAVAVVAGLAMPAARAASASSSGLPRDPTAPAAVDVEDPPVMPLKDVKAGQKGKGYTVFSSRVGPEEFSFEVLGVMRGYLGPGEDLIIARLTGAQIERTGVISGMSGSPAYIDGKLIGAVGYRFGQFTKDPIAGITPIERMKTGESIPASSSSSKIPVFADTPWGRAQPVATPLIVSGLSPVVAAAFADKLQERGYGNMIAAGAVAVSSSNSSAQKPVRFYAAGPIAGLLVDGDLSMAGIGTVTWVKGDRFLAFGHPFLGTGKTEMPVSNAEIVTTVASEAGSWKMGQATAPVGRLTDDRLHAIAGTMGDAPQTVPVSLTFDLHGPRKGSDARTTERFSVIRHPTDTPLFCAIAIANALQNRVAVDAGGTFDVVVDTLLSTGDRVVLPARSADKNADPALPTAFAVLAALSNLTESDYADVEVKSVSVTVKSRPEVEQARIVSASVVSRVKSGKSAVVDVRLQSFQGAARQQRIEFVLPRGLDPGSYAVVVAAAGPASRIEREGGLLALPTTFSEELTLIKNAPPPGSITVYLVRDESSPRLGGRALPGLPDSLAEITSGSGGLFGGGAFEARAARLARAQTTGVIIGEASARITVTASEEE